ncbi:MAG: hypothetical protein P4L77_10775 [Sulfuriferula sp.]|nr:hypothetical protein [Sulfuriferula sp.]
MALFPDPLTSIYAAIQTQNGITLDPTQYGLTNPTPYTDPAGLTNTQLTLSPNTVQSPYVGSVTVSYFRWLLSDLLKQLPLPLKFNGLTTALTMAQAMNTYFGTNFTAADIVDGPVTVNPDGSGTLTLTAQANSLGWVGTVNLPFILGNFNLATAIAVTALPGLMYPERDETKPYGEAYSYWRDFSASQATLVTHTPADTDLTDVANALSLNAGSGVTWVLTGASRYSLAGASITYNGTTAAYPLDSSGNPQVNLAYSNVMTVLLDPVQCTGYSGTLIMHYNVPGSDGIPG